MFDEDLISRIRGSSTMIVWRGGEREIAGEKIKPPLLIFSDTIFVIQFPPSQSQDPRIHDIVSSSNIFENLDFFYMLDEDAISWIRVSCNCDGGGVGGVDDENCSQKKSETKKSVGFSLTFTDI